MGDLPLTLIAARVAAVKTMCEKTKQILDEVIADSKDRNDTGLAFAAMHLQDSLSAFSAACERSIIKDYQEE